MKSIILVLIYITTFMFFFFVFSLVGLLWTDYISVITEGGWFGCYALFLGSWLSALPCQEYYENNKEYFDRIFS